MKEVVIKVEDLGKRYFINRSADTISSSFNRIFTSRRTKEEFWALKDVSFEVYKGESIGIIGRNGAGKSTLLKVLSKITPPTQGKATIHGQVASLLEVGTGFHPELTGRENIFLNGALLGMNRRNIQTRLDEIIEFSGVEKFIDTPVKKYSSGMYVRLAFAVAAHLDSDILFVDEVLAVGDFEFQQKCLGKMNNLSRDLRKTVILVSHNINLIRSFCNKVIKLENSKVVAFGETDKVLIEENAKESMELESGNSIIKNLSIRQIGSVLRIMVSYNSQEEVTFPNFSFVISNSINQNLFGGNTMYLEQNVRGPFPLNGQLTIDIQEPLLLDGEYFLSIWFGISKYYQPIVMRNILKFKIRGMAEVSFNFKPVDYGNILPKWKLDVEVL